MIITFVIIAAVLVAEHFIKRKISLIPEENMPVPLAKGHISIRKIKNPGMILGFLKSRPLLTYILPGITILALLVCVIIKCIKGLSLAGKIGFGLLLGGGISNLFDRIINGGVTDYINLPKCKIKKLRKIIFNLADICTFIGAVIALFAKSK